MALARKEDSNNISEHMNKISVESVLNHSYECSRLRR